MTGASVHDGTELLWWAANTHCSGEGQLVGDNFAISLNWHKLSLQRDS